MRHWGDVGMESVELSAATLPLYDCVVISTNHAAYDYQMIADNASLIVDARGALRDVTGPRDHIISA
jgi:UDP-N-acetyl-D-glucosamine dehydrogenase